MYEGETYIDSGTRSNEFMIGLLVGAAVGAAVGLLLAPKSGAELRHQLADYSERFRRRAGETYERASETMSDLAQRGRETVNDLRAPFTTEGTEGNGESTENESDKNLQA